MLPQWNSSKSIWFSHQGHSIFTDLFYWINFFWRIAIWKPSNFASEDAANAICKGKVTDPTTGGGGGTGTTAATGTGATAATGTGTTAATTTTGDKTGKDPKDPKSTEGKPTR